MLSNEVVGSGGDEIKLNTSTSLSKGRVGPTKVGTRSTYLASLFKGRVGSIEDGTRLTALTSLFNGRVGSNKDGIGSNT